MYTWIINDKEFDHDRQSGNESEYENLYMFYILAQIMSIACFAIRYGWNGTVNLLDIVLNSYILVWTIYEFYFCNLCNLVGWHLVLFRGELRRRRQHGRQGARVRAKPARAGSRAPLHAHTRRKTAVTTTKWLHLTHRLSRPEIYTTAHAYRTHSDRDDIISI